MPAFESTIGFIGIAIKKVAEAYLPDPWTDVEVVQTNPTTDGVVYDVIIDGISSAVMNTRGKLELVPGIYHIPETEIISTEVIRDRALRKTLKLKIKVHDVDNFNLENVTEKFNLPKELITSNRNIMS